MTPRPGTPFMGYALVAPFLVVLASFIWPQVARGFNYDGQIGSFELLFHFNSSRTSVSPAFISYWTPSPIMVVGHLGLFIGGLLMNRGRADTGLTLVVFSSLAMIPFPLVAGATAWIWDEMRVLELERSDPIFSIGLRNLAVPVLYSSTLFAVSLSGLILRTALDKTEPVRPKSLRRSLLLWGGASGFLLLAALLLYRGSPEHAFTIVNKSGRNIVLIAVEANGRTIAYGDYLLEPYDSDSRNPSISTFGLRGWFWATDLRLRFRSEGNSAAKYYVARTKTGFNFECFFVVKVYGERITVSSCRRYEPEIRNPLGTR